MRSFYNCLSVQWPIEAHYQFYFQFFPPVWTNKPNRDAFIITTLDTFTSLLAGTTIFAILGNLAFNLNTDISNVVRGGAGLAFVSYPDAIAKFTWLPQFFSALFFFMLAVLGVGSAVALQSAVNTVIWDQMPKVKYWKVAIVVSVSGYLIGLVYVTPGGQWILELVDYFGGTFVIFALVRYWTRVKIRLQSVMKVLLLSLGHCWDHRLLLVV